MNPSTSKRIACTAAKKTLVSFLTFHNHCKLTLKQKTEVI